MKFKRTAGKFPKLFAQQVVDWFNAQNDSEFLPNMQQMLFATFKNAANQVPVKKFNYTLHFMKVYVYVNKLSNNSLTLSEFTNKIKIEYKI